MTQAATAPVSAREPVLSAWAPGRREPARPETQPAGPVRPGGQARRRGRAQVRARAVLLREQLRGRAPRPRSIPSATSEEPELQGPGLVLGEGARHERRRVLASPAAALAAGVSSGPRRVVRRGDGGRDGSHARALGGARRRGDGHPCRDDGPHPANRGAYLVQHRGRPRGRRDSRGDRRRHPSRERLRRGDHQASSVAPHAQELPASSAR